MVKKEKANYQVPSKLSFRMSSFCFQVIDPFGLVNVVPNSTPLGIKRFVPVISISFKYECYIIMQIQYTKNLKPRRFELGTTLILRNGSIVISEPLRCFQESFFPFRIVEIKPKGALEQFDRPTNGSLSFTYHRFHFVEVSSFSDSTQIFVKEDLQLCSSELSEPLKSNSIFGRLDV